MPRDFAGLFYFVKNDKQEKIYPGQLMGYLGFVFCFSKYCIFKWMRYEQVILQDFASRVVTAPFLV